MSLLQSLQEDSLIKSQSQYGPKGKTKHTEALTKGRSGCLDVSEKNEENRLDVGVRVQKEPGLWSPDDRASLMLGSVFFPS